MDSNNSTLNNLLTVPSTFIIGVLPTGNDTISGFAAGVDGNDLIETDLLHSFQEVLDASYEDQDGFAVIVFGDNITATLLDVSLDDLDANDFVFV